MALRALAFGLQASLAIASGDLAEDLKELTSRFPGHYTNYLQWEEGVEMNYTQDKAHPLLFSIFHGPLDLPSIGLGPELFYVQEFMEGDPSKVYRQRLYSFVADEARGEIVLSIFRFHEPSKYLDSDRHPEQLMALTAEDVYAVKGCEVYIQRSGDVFEGSTKTGECRTVDHRTNRTLRLEDNNVFGADFVSIHEVGYDEESGEKVFGMEDSDMLNRTTAPRLFSGYIYAEDYPVMTSVELYDCGMQVPLLDADGKETEWRMELAKVTYEATDVTVLKLAAHQAGYVHGGLVLPRSYSWTAPESHKVGINIREIEAGFSLVDAPGQPGMAPRARRIAGRLPVVV